MVEVERQAQSSEQGSELKGSNSHSPRLQTGRGLHRSKSCGFPNPDSDASKREVRGRTEFWL